MTQHREAADLVVNVKGRNMAVTDAIHDHAVEKMRNLSRYLDRLSTIDVLLSVEHSRNRSTRHMAEATARVRGKLLRAQVVDADMYAAIDGLVHKLHLQLTRHKERTQAHRGAGVSASMDALTGAQPRDATEEYAELAEVEEPALAGRIVRSKHFTLKPMFADEAVDELEELGHAFFVFLNAETEQVNVLYKRKDGAYGLIEPAFE